MRPLAVGDAVNILRAALIEGRLARRTTPITGPTELEFDDAVRLLATVLGKRTLLLREIGRAHV